MPAKSHVEARSLSPVTSLRRAGSARLGSRFVLDRCSFCSLEVSRRLHVELRIGRPVERSWPVRSRSSDLDARQGAGPKVRITCSGLKRTRRLTNPSHKLGKVYPDNCTPDKSFLATNRIMVTRSPRLLDFRRSGAQNLVVGAWGNCTSKAWVSFGWTKSTLHEKAYPQTNQHISNRERERERAREREREGERHNLRILLVAICRWCRDFL